MGKFSSQIRPSQQESENRGNAANNLLKNNLLSDSSDLLGDNLLRNNITDNETATVKGSDMTELTQNANEIQEEKDIATNSSQTKVDDVFFAPDGKFLYWGATKSANAIVKIKDSKDVIKTLQTNDKGKKRDMTITEFLNRAHWAFGEGSGIAAEYYSHAINNKVVKYGEDGIYKYMVSAGESGTSEQRKKTNFSGDHENKGVVKDEDPYNVFAKAVNTINDRTKNLEGINSNPMIQHLIKEMIEVLQGEADPTGGARHWAGDESSVTYAKNNSQKGSTITVIRSVANDKVSKTHVFYLLDHPKGGYETFVEKYVNKKDEKVEKPVEKKPVEKKKK